MRRAGFAAGTALVVSASTALAQGPVVAAPNAPTPPAAAPSAAPNVAPPPAVPAPPATITPAPRARRAAPPPDDDVEQRLVVYTDGQSPRIVASGTSSVHGELELEVRFRNANPLCYEYSTNVAASRVAASDQPLPDLVPGLGALGAPSSTGFSGLEDAVTAVNNSETELDDIENAARMQTSLDDVWAACDGGGDFLMQRARVESAARIAAQRLGPLGAWRRVLENAEAVALGAKRLSRDLAAGEHDAAEDDEARKVALTDAERKESATRAAVARAGYTKKSQAEIETAERDLAAAQRKLREGDLTLMRHRRAGELEHAAERLADRVHRTLDMLGTNVADISRARSLLARSPTAIRRRFGVNEAVSVVVERTRLDRGERVADRGPQRFEVPAYVTRRPVFFDIGIGPALGIGRDTAAYAAEWAPANAQDPNPAWRIERTKQGLPLDGMLSISAYVWEPRYYDDKVFDPMQLVPRPMLGVSLIHPTHELYAGLQIDPLQFLDISGGVRFADETTLVGPQVSDHALIDASGAPEPPITRNEVRASGFVAVTVSANLIYNFFRSGP